MEKDLKQRVIWAFIVLIFGLFGSWFVLYITGNTRQEMLCDGKIYQGNGHLICAAK